MAIEDRFSAAPCIGYNTPVALQKPAKGNHIEAKSILKMIHTFIVLYGFCIAETCATVCRVCLVHLTLYVLGSSSDVGCVGSITAQPALSGLPLCAVVQGCQITSSVAVLLLLLPVNQTRKMHNNPRFCHDRIYKMTKRA